MQSHPTSPAPRHQQGMVLIIALIILLVLTILGVAGMSTSSLQSRMAANAHDRQIAFQTAEAALRAGEDYVQNHVPNNSTYIANTFTTNCTNGLCDCSSTSTVCPVYWTDPTLNVWSTAGKHVTVTTNFNQVAEQPMYIIEFMGWVPNPGQTTNIGAQSNDPMLFRITALGTGQSPNAKVMLQSTYKTP